MADPRDSPSAPAGAYREHAPDPGLAPWVECFWSISCSLAPGAPTIESVLPDGCMDMLFDLGEPPGRDERASVPEGLVGAMTRPLAVAYSGRIDLFGIRLRPAGASAFMAVPAWEVADRVVPLEDVWGAEASRLRDRLGASSDPLERVELASRALRSAARHRGEPPDERVLAACDLIAAREGRVRVSVLSRSTGLGTRQLERLFREHVGLTPKGAARIARFRSVVHRLHSMPDGSLSRIAHSAGYADQAHMTRDFTALAGRAPAAYRRMLAAR